MKISFVFQFLPLLILFIGIPALAADSLPEPVRDENGDILRSGADYYILPFFRGRVGGVTLRPTRNNTCPLDVVQSSIQVSNGTPFRFTPVDPKKGVIRVSTDLNIDFSGATTCIQSTVWQLADFDELTGQTFITTRGKKGNPGRETVRNWFKIVKQEVGMYKFVFCPAVCDVCRPRCGNIGIYIEDGVRRLALLTGPTSEPMWIRFKKAKTGSVYDD